VIKAHNEKVFGPLENNLDDSIEVIHENKENQAALPSINRISIPKEKPVEGKSNPSDKIPSSLAKKLPDSVRDDILAHLKLVNMLNKQVNELVMKASRVFSEQDTSTLSTRKLHKEEKRLNKN